MGSFGGTFKEIKFLLMGDDPMKSPIVVIQAKNARIVFYGFTNANVPSLDEKTLLQLYEKELKFKEGSVHLYKISSSSGSN